MIARIITVKYSGYNIVWSKHTFHDKDFKLVRRLSERQKEMARESTMKRFNNIVKAEFG